MCSFTFLYLVMVVVGSTDCVVVVAVLVTFFVCWAPFHAQRVLTVCVPDDRWTSTLIEIQSTLFYVSGSLLTPS